MSSKFTAVDYLVESIFNESELQDPILKLAIQQAKAMEKEQIIEAVIWFDNTERNPKQIEKEAEYYYKSTYE
jgi:hypothetical protein